MRKLTSTNSIEPSTTAATQPIRPWTESCFKRCAGNDARATGPRACGSACGASTVIWGPEKSTVTSPCAQSTYARKTSAAESDTRMMNPSSGIQSPLALEPGKKACEKSKIIWPTEAQPQGAPSLPDRFRYGVSCSRTNAACIVQEMSRPKLLVIGLDGASFDVLDPLMKSGLMPNLQTLVSAGARSELRTTFPPITAVAWSSFITGKNPGKHGIFEFVRRDTSSDREVAVNASFRQGDAIWDILGKAGQRVIVHNFPCTYPPHCVNGILISDFMTPRDRRDYTYPRELLEEIEARFGPYRLHLHQTYSRGNVGNVLDELFDELEYKALVAEYLMTENAWDAFFQYFWGTDRIQHELWHIIDESHPRYDRGEASQYKDRVYRYFTRVDEIVGRLAELAGKEAMVWIASDHGFGPVHTYCSFNIWMMKEGFLKVKRTPLSLLKRVMFNLGVTPELAFRILRSLPLGKLRPSRGVSSQPGASKALKALFLSSSDIDWTRTKAFSKGNYGQIYVNLMGRERHGSVDPSDYADVCDRIVERLRQIQDPGGSGAWLEQISLRSDIYEGPLVDNAPDVCFLPKDMRYLATGNADFTSNRFMVPAFGISGSHRMNGILIGSGGPIKRGFSASTSNILDVTPTLLYLSGQGIPEDMDGRLLTEMIEGDFILSHPILGSSGPTRDEREPVDLSAEENDEIIERLKALGYVG